MGRTVRNPKKCIISCRIDDHEMETLDRLSREVGINISDLLRQSIFRLERELRVGTL